MNEIMQRINVIDQRTQAQGQPPPLVDQATPSSTPMTLPTSTDIPASEEPAKWLRAKLPDVLMFTGKRSEWRPWKNRMEQKLDQDGLAIGDKKD